MHRSREEAIFDRFIAVHLGTSLRQIESSLSEESESEYELFHRLQPQARAEDLMLELLPLTLLRRTGEPGRCLPLPHSHLSITFTPAKVRLLLSNVALNVGLPHVKRSRELVVEVRKQPTLEQSVQSLGEALEDIHRGFIEWGSELRN